MTNAEFQSLTKMETFIGANACLKSARALFKVAQDAASTAQFGVANSLLILSTEECIKCAVFLGAYFGTPPPQGVAGFFKSHSTKHDQAGEIQPVVNFIAQARSAFTHVFKYRKSAYGTVFNFAIATIFAHIGYSLQQESSKLTDFGSWWKQANTRKNDGFYVDFRKGYWTIPTDVSQATYEETLSYVRPFVECLEILEHLQPDDYVLLDPNRQFTEKEIQESGIKLTSVDEKDAGHLDSSGYSQQGPLG